LIFNGLLKRRLGHPVVLESVENLIEIQIESLGRLSEMLMKRVVKTRRVVTFTMTIGVKSFGCGY